MQTASTPRADWVSLLLALMMLLVPATGIPSQYLLQDTWKSFLVASFTLCTAIAWVHRLAKTGQPVQVPTILLLPALLMLYALGSMAWAHAYLAGVEAVRWFILGLLTLLAANLRTQAQVERILWGIHWGGVTASLWVVLQFLFDFGLFPQGPNPASTFVNRNFYAEYAVGSLPLSLYLAQQNRSRLLALVWGVGTGLTLTGILMAGSRSALVALGLVLLLAPPLLRWQQARPRPLGPAPSPAPNHWGTSLAALVAVLLLVGIWPTGNPQLVQEFGHANAFERAAGRAKTLANPSEYQNGSLAVRLELWATTLRMVQAHPLAGVGAGAWEVVAPLHQNSSSQIERDFYAHNEFLQLVAEYGLLGWFCLAVLLLFLGKALANLAKALFQPQAAARAGTGPPPTPVSPATSNPALVPGHQPWGLLALGCLLLVGQTGFPWHLAGTGALFFLLFGLVFNFFLFKNFNYKNSIYMVFFIEKFHNLVKILFILLLFLTAFVFWRAAVCEYKLVRGVQMAVAIAKAPNPQDPSWAQDKNTATRLVMEAIAINPHYRKISPAAGDAMASWGDWANAAAVWQSALQSRPNVVALWANLARARMRLRQFGPAQEALDRATAIRPQAPALIPLQVLIWQGQGATQAALQRAADQLEAGRFDPELLQTSYALGVTHNTPRLAEHALQLQIRHVPGSTTLAWLRLGHLYSTGPLANEDQARQAFEAALASVAPRQKTALLQEIPHRFRPSPQP